ncbi:ZC11A protein, partial [Mionectes macconnelli]|nr:ZC11A protein [Mionectes macconnelli]
MSNQGDDCYFYFYSTCNKGDSCAFRHCEAALGSETVCTLWQEGRCFRNVCRFRHMEIDKKRSEIACYWENQPGGCQKYNCAFHHTKGRYVDGLFLPPSKTTLPSPPESAEDDVKMAQMSLQQNKLSVQSNPSPQLRGVMKVENSENVPSPTHPPVVINAADDDEDDDDQLSEEGEETKTPVQQPATEAHNGLRLISTRKSNANTKQDDNLNFGIKTLEEIKLKKLKEKAKKQGEGPSGVAVDPLQARTIPVPEKENVRTVLRTVTLSSKEGENCHFMAPKSNLEVIIKRTHTCAGKTFLPLRRNVADRLGRKTEMLENAEKAPRRGTEKAAKPFEEIRVKTLEEIRLERAKQRRGEPPGKAPCEARRAEEPGSGTRPSPPVRIKSLSGALAEKNHKRLEEEKEKPEEFPAKPKAEGEARKNVPAPAVPGRVQLAEPGRAKPAGEVRIKTLEEIKREKALRMQQSGENVPAPPAQPEPALRGRKLLRVTKLIAPGREEKMIVELNKPSPKTVSAAAEPSGQSAANSTVQVKSLEEIMWEKRQLKQRQEKLQKEAAAVPTPVEKPAKDKTPPSGSPESTVCLKPLDGKATSSPRQTLKRKATESHPTAVVAVKPLSATGGDTKEPSTRKAAVRTMPEPAEGPPATPELHLGNQAGSLAQSEVSSSTSASSEVPVKMRRLSSTGSAKAPLSVEDDFEKLIWEISGGKLEAEIDLDPGKDEDDLLLELSEMIDS